MLNRELTEKTKGNDEMIDKNTVKSQDDTRSKQDARSSDVLIKALEKCELLEKENAQLIQKHGDLATKLYQLDRKNKELYEIIDRFTAVIKSLNDWIAEKEKYIKQLEGKTDE